VLAAGGSELFSFSVRASEIAGTAGGQLILRVATSGGATPQVLGLTPLSVLSSGDTTTALFAITAEGLYRLEVIGGGAYQLQLGVAGDLNTDGRVDGLDSAAIQATGAFVDITGDGLFDRADRQVLYANHGYTVNAGPQLAATLPQVLTHEDLGVLVDLSKVASDPDGDTVYYRIVGVDNGRAALTPDGRYLLYKPTPGYTGPAALRLVADDGFSASPLAELTVTVSDAPLLGIEFVQRKLLGDVGDNFLVVLQGDFADQQDVILPLDYVDIGLLDPSIATLSAQGLLTLAKDGATALVASRGGVVAATVVGVGDPSTPADLLTLYYGIDAYPDAVAILPNGGTRQVIVKRGSTGSVYISKATDGTLYFSGNDAVASVSDDGLITGRAVGETQVTVINRFAEDQVLVRVEAPKSSTGTAVIGEVGGIVANADGVMVAFGPGQVQGNATVSVTSVSEAQLSLPTPRAPDGTETFKYVGAFDFDIQGGEIEGPVQAAIRCGAISRRARRCTSSRRCALPIGPDGAEGEIWVVVDSAIVGADGMARTASPPFPGLSNRGSVLIARAAQPVGIINIDVGFLTGIAVATAMTLGMGAASGSLLGAVAFSSIAAASPRWRRWPSWARSWRSSCGGSGVPTSRARTGESSAGRGRRDHHRAVAANAAAGSGRSGKAAHHQALTRCWSRRAGRAGDRSR
jgi:large repetitive protein